MNKHFKISILAFSLLVSVLANAQKKITDGTISYDIIINTSNPNPKLADMLDGATSTVYIKGNSSRSEMVSSLGVQSTIINGKTGNVTVLKEYGDQKYMIQMTADNWKESNKKYDGITFQYLDETKVIAGYSCKKAIGTLTDGSTFTVYYTTELEPSNKDFLYLNKGLPGLAMEYESTMGNLKVLYTVSKISFNPTPVSKFDIPKSGFRVMTYEESRKLGSGR